MRKVVADANVFLRFLLNDIPKQYLEAKQLFDLAKRKKIGIIVPQIIIFEVIFTMDKYYHFEKDHIIEGINALINTSFLEIQDRELFQQALSIWKFQNISVADCFLLARVEHDQVELFSFDKNLNSLANEQK